MTAAAGKHIGLAAGGPGDILQRLAVYHGKGMKACPVRSRKRGADGARPGSFVVLYRPTQPDIAVQDTERWAGQSESATTMTTQAVIFGRRGGLLTWDGRL